jgi:hypothetical protein
MLTRFESPRIKEMLLAEHQVDNPEVATVVSISGESTI